MAGNSSTNPSPNAIDELLARVARLPGLGTRSAQRIVLQLLQNQETMLAPLLQALTQAQAQITECETCGQLDTKSPCHICTDATRDTSLLCVVETQADLWALERAKTFRGRYHVLGGHLSALDGVRPESLNLASLKARCEQHKPEEVILAMNATVEGQTTAHYITDMLKPLGVKITRLAHGVPVGGELDYLDAGTLEHALASRTPF